MSGKAMTLRLDTELAEQLGIVAEVQKQPISEVIRAAITEYLAMRRNGCDVCGKPPIRITTPGGFRFCDDCPPRKAPHDD